MQTALFKLLPSRYLYRSVFIIYALLITSLVFSGVYQIIIITAILSCIGSLYGLNQQQYCWTALGWHPKTGWAIYDNQLQAYDITVLNSSYCSSFLVILNGRGKAKNNQKISLIILPDSMPHKDFKCLRRYLLNGTR